MFKRHVDPPVTSGTWSMSEKYILDRARTYYGDDCSAIATCLPGRTGVQVFNKYSSLAEKSGKWTAEEDAVLRERHSDFFEAARMLRRSESSCRTRYTLHLDPTLKKEKFSAQEREAIIETVKRVGAGKWAEIAGIVGGGRTRLDVRNVWKTYEKSLARKPKPSKKRKAAEIAPSE
jgi:hypothetical protein